MAINPKLLELLEEDEAGRKTAGLGTSKINIEDFLKVYGNRAANQVPVTTPIQTKPSDLLALQEKQEEDRLVLPHEEFMEKNKFGSDSSKNDQKEYVSFAQRSYDARTQKERNEQAKKNISESLSVPSEKTTNPSRNSTNSGGKIEYTAADKLNNAVNNVLGRPITNLTEGVVGITAKLGENLYDTGVGLGAAIKNYDNNMPERSLNPITNFRNNWEQFINASEEGIRAYQNSIMQEGRFSEKIESAHQARENLQSQNSHYLFNRFNDALYSTGQMVPTLIMGALAGKMGLTGMAKEAVGVLPIAVTSNAEYSKNAMTSMLRQNSELMEQGLPPKFSEDEMMRISAAAGVGGIIIEAGMEIALDGALGTGQGYLDDVFAKIPVIKSIAGSATAPVAKALWTFLIEKPTEEGIEEFVQGVSEKLMIKMLYDKDQTVFSKEDWLEYRDSFVVGTMMGLSGQVTYAVKSTAGGVMTQVETAKYAKAVDSVRNAADVADANVAIEAALTRNETFLSELEKVYTEEQIKGDPGLKYTKEIVEWQNEQFEKLLDILADGNVKQDIIENNKARSAEGQNSILKTGIEQMYEQGEAENFNAKRDERITSGKASEYGLDLKPAVKGETAEQRRARLDANKETIRAYEEEHRAEIRERKRQEGLKGKTEEFKKILDSYGIKDVVIDDNNLTFYDKKTGNVHISAKTSTEQAVNIKVGHEVGHAMANADGNFVKDLIAFMRTVETDVDEQIAKAKEGYIRYLQETEGLTEAEATEKVDDPYAMEEVACEFLGNANRLGGMLDALAKKNGNLLRRIYNRVMDLVDKYTGKDSLARRYRQLAKDMRDALNENGFEIGDDIKDTSAQAAAERTDRNGGIKETYENEESKETINTRRYDYRVMERDEQKYRDLLKGTGKYDKEELDAIFDVYDTALDLIKGHLEELDFNYEGDYNRGFKPMKPNSDPLYKISMDFSTLCRKRIMQQLAVSAIQEQLEDKDRVLTKEEQAKLRDKLIELRDEGLKIEVACGLCYVEAARLKSPSQIKKFFANRAQFITEYFAEIDPSTAEKMKQAEAETKVKYGYDADATIKSLPKNVQDAVRNAKKKVQHDYALSEEQREEIAYAESLRQNDFTDPEKLRDMLDKHPALYDAYTNYVRRATHSKGVESDVNWEYGDSDEISKNLIEKMNAENGMRVQSWSDFQTMHLMDYIASTIELSAKNVKRQSYTKVVDYVNLMGRTGDMINMSLIPAEKYNGTLEFDSKEGMDFDEMMKLREKYHDTCGNISIGITDKQIKQLLDSGDIDYVIPYHHSGLSKDMRKRMHLPEWISYQDKQTEKKRDYPNTDKDGGQYQKEPKFSEWFDLEKARATAERENKLAEAGRPSDLNAYVKYGVQYGAYMAMREAANNYIDICHQRGLQEKFTEFSGEDNYWKLLIDRKMVDNVTGDIIEQKAIRPNFDVETVKDILNREIENYPQKKQDENKAIRESVKWWNDTQMSKEQKSKKTEKSLEKPVDNVLAEGGVKKTRNSRKKTEAAAAAEADTGNRFRMETDSQVDAEYMDAVETGDIREQKRMVKEAAQQNGFDTTDLYHGTPKFGFTEFNTGLIFATDNKSVAAGYGTRGYAYPREVFKKYVQDDGTDATLIKNVRNILNEEYSEVSEKQIEKTKQDILKRAKELDKKVMEIWQFGDDFPELDVENSNRLSNVLALTGDVIYEIEDAPRYGEEGKAAQDSIERFFRDYEDLREYFVDHYEDFQGETGKPIYDMVTKFELSDFAIDAKYTLLPVFDADNYLVNERGKYAEKENIRERVERVKDVGSYHLYGKLGDKPLVIDTSENGRNGYWANIKTPEGFSKEYLNTEALAKEAKAKGYTSVVLKNLMDIAGNDYSSNVPSTVYVFFNSGDLKAADPVTYDDAGNVIPLSERFNDRNKDIRYRMEKDDDSKPISKRVHHATGSKADIREKSKITQKNAKAMEDYAATPLSEYKGKERETAIDMKLRYWDKMASMFKRQGSEAGDAEKELLMQNYQEGIFGDPNDILARARFMQKLAEIGGKTEKDAYTYFMYGASAELRNALEKQESARQEQHKRDQQTQREIEYERQAQEFNRDMSEAPLPNAPTNEEYVIPTTDEFGEAPPELRDVREQAIAYDSMMEEERQREKEHFYRRAEALAEQYNLDNTYDLPTRETYNGEEITPEDLEGISIPDLENKPTVKEKVESERVARAEIQIMDSMREYDHEKDLIRKRAQAMEAKQTRKLAESVRDKIQSAIKKLVPVAAFRNSEAVSAENRLTAEDTIRRDKEQKTIRNRMKLLEKRMYDVETDTSLIKEWKYSDADHRAELENQNETVREYAGLYRRAAEIRQQKSSGKAYKNDFYRIGAELQKRLSSLGGFPTIEELDDIGAWILTELVDYTEGQGEAVKDFIHEYNSLDEKGRSKLLKQAEERLGKTKAREVTGILSLYDQVFDATFGIDDKLREIKDKWKNFEEDTIKNSRKLAAQKERYESYQADIDIARFHLGSDITPEQLEKIRAEIEEKRKTLDKMRVEISDEDRISARRFLDDNANVEKSERETARYLRAYAVAEFILGEGERSKLEADETAVSRLESQYRTAQEKSDAFRREHRAEMDRYTRQGFTDDSAEIFVRRDMRMQEEREINRNSVLAKLGYKIAAPIRDDYGMSSFILESEAKAKEIGNRISDYIEGNSVSRYVIGIAKDIAAGKMTLLEVDSTPQYRDIMGKRVATGRGKVLPSSGLTGANLDHARVLSTLYAEQNDYLEGGIKARKRAISDELTSTLNAVFEDYDFAANLKESGKLSSKVFDYLMHYSSPENIMTDVFGDNGVADYLTEQYITPVIRNAAEARRMTNRQTKRLNDLNLTKQESALTQIIAEYSNLRDITEAVNSDVDGETIINLGTLINLLEGSMSAEELARRIARAKAGEAFDGKRESKYAKQQQKASKEAYDEAYLHSEEVEEMHEEAEANADFNDKDAYGGEEWEGLVNTLKQIQYQAKGADAKKIAEKCMKAADTCRELMNDMYDAFNEMYVTHGGQRMNFRKDYMPHQQTEDVQAKMNEVMKMMEMDPVTEIPAAIQGRTRDNRPYSKWLSFRQHRTGEKTTYDAVGNIYNYLSAANQALYHIDDIFKLRHLETYVRSIHERELQDFQQVIANRMVDADIMEGDNGPKTSNTQYGRFAEWLKLYTDDICGKQVYRDAESMWGRLHLNTWSAIQRLSNKTMLAFNLASAMKQISQVPTVMSELGVVDTIDAFMDAMNDNNTNQSTYDILGRSTFLAEKEKIEEIDYREYRNRKEEKAKGLLNSLEERDASIGSMLKDKADTISEYLQGFDRFNSKFAVYAYFKQGMENGMTSDEALAYADRRARQINASRLRGAQPLAFRNKGIIQSVLNMYQRETVAQIENLAKYMPRQMKKFYEENGKDATAKLITKRIVQHQLITAAFNTAFYALGIGTPAMFDVLGSFIRAAWSNFKHIPGDDERDLFEKIMGAGGNLGDEILDDLPIVSTIYELVAGDSTNRLPIYSINFKKLGKAITNCKTLAELQKKLENSGSELEAKMIKEMMDAETEAAGVNLLLTAIDLSGAFVEGGSQMRKTITALIDLANGGRYSHGAGAGNLQYQVGAKDALPALLFGTSGLPQAKDYYAGNAGLSATATQAYKELLAQEIPTDKAYDMVREVSKQKNNADKNAALDKLNTGMEAKASIYMGLIASDAEKRAYDLAAAGLKSKDRANVVYTIRGIKGASGQADKLGVLLDAGLENQQTEDIYMEMIASWETDENGHRVRITDADKYLACREAGMDIKDYLTAKKAYKDIYDMDLTASQKAAELYKWAKESGDYSARQIEAITQNLSYYSNVKAEADSYRKYEDKGIDLDTSMEIYNAMRGKTTNADKVDTLIGLNLSKDDMRNALSASLSDSTWKLVRDGLDSGMDIKNYAKVIRADADGNKRLSSAEREAAIRKLPISDKQKSVLWIATGGSVNSDPFKEKETKKTQTPNFSGGFGAGFDSGFGGGFGSGFGSGFGGGFDDDFLSNALNAYKK